MQPVLYNKSGYTAIGDLTEMISASVVEQRNGAYTASFTYPYVGEHFPQIDYDSIVLLKPNQKREPQKFRVSSISKPINGIVSYGCEHVSYELNKNPTLRFSGTDSSIINGTAEQVLTRIFLRTTVACPYFGTSDIPDVKKCELEFMSARDAIFKVQQYFGGELEWDNYNVILHNSRGFDSGAVISYGNNLLDYSQKIDVSNIYTAIVPYMQVTGENGDKTLYTLPERYLTYYNADQYSYIRAKAVDFTDEFTEQEQNKSGTEIVALLRSKAMSYITANNDYSFIFHNRNATLSYIDLRKAKEFAAIETMNDLGLCDWVTLKDDRLGVSFKGQIITTKFNVLTEMYDSIEIGNPTDQLLDTLASIVNFNSSTTVGETVEEIKKNLDEYYSEIKVTDNKITFKSGNIKNIEGVYNTYAYKLERDTDIQEEGKLGRIISIIDPKNRKTKIVRK